MFKGYSRKSDMPRAGRVPGSHGGTIKNNPIVPKKNERLERILKNIGTISKRTEQNGNCLKKLLTRSYYQELILSWERILN